MRQRTGVYLKCETCGEDFYVPPCRIKQAESKGAITRYCSMKCYVKTGERNPFWGKKHSRSTIKKLTANPNRPRFKTGEDNPNFSRFAEDRFVGKTIGWWKAWFRKNVGKCEKCGYDECVAILEVHHLDQDTSNNTRANLRFLCPNHHQLWHYENKNGRFKRGAFKKEGKRKEGIR